MLSNFSNLAEAINFSRELLKCYGETVKTESWQGLKQEVTMFEYCNIYWAAQMPHDMKTLLVHVKPDMPWAEQHFGERVGGKPLNPGETYKKWPYYKDKDFNDKNFRNVIIKPIIHRVPGIGFNSLIGFGEEEDNKFTHTYMERYWPKYAGHSPDPSGNIDITSDNVTEGIRYKYGDLKDVVNLLAKEPYTRQAYLPVWFPEDTGVLHGGRVPCSIGYHFIMRNNRLNIHYMIRACDFIRHFRNDIYLTVRLVYWVLDRLGIEWKEVRPGLLTMDIVSLHVFDKEKNLI